ncbi:FadR/GntR family transcriptional regulator [Agromyces archimandritae]|uniref:FadR family transcriptional regulator n=1 Tax=Agromyces archimandritae TaxID=2781962 RepID=A0A975FM26_9MICO|nr:FCD domain-containing protein [Agromyces archimandritae]QTX04409.1 FadR family transcriptional regulator [Agromyces archimandritae]
MRIPGRQLIAQRLREEIFDGMRPGDRIGTETQLAERFGVSRITMRDAVRVLESEGFVEVAVGVSGGLRVAAGRPDIVADALSTQLYLEDVSWRELVDAMHIIEPALAGLAAEAATPDDVARLRAIVAQAPGSDEATEFTEAALDFHLALAEIAGNRPLTASVRAMRAAQRRRFAPETTAATVASVTEIHARIVDAVERHDAEAAAAAMHAHLGRLGAAAR